MICKEYGTNNKEVIVLLHGGGLSWWNYREEAEMLQDDYHIILPVLDGHSSSDRSFTSIEDNASEFIAFIDERFNGSVRMIGGLSLGAQVLLEMLSQRNDICQCALVESPSVIPSKMTNALIGPAFGSSYGLIRNKRFAKLQAESLHIRPELFEDYYRDTCLISKADMISFMKANTAYALKDGICRSTAEIHLYAGEKETGIVKKSVEQIHAVLPDSTVTVLPGLYHGEFSLNHPEAYVQAVRKIALL